MRSVLVLGFACLFPVLPPDVPASSRAAAKPAGVEELCAAFREYSGARLVFEAGDLPAGQYHDSMPSLDTEGRLKAARVAVAEVKKLPAGYLRGIGLEAVGIFRACVSQTGDGFRPYDETLKGYRYFGIWNGKNAAACACYSPEQLVLTLHHEVFHHVDATRRGQTRGSRLREDNRLAEALSGKSPYPAAAIGADDLAALKARSRGVVLEGAVSRYAAKNPAEDRAETARHLMSQLPDALVQGATRPGLAGSQRILHVLECYRRAAPDDATTPTLAWFVAVALDRTTPTLDTTLAALRPLAAKLAPGQVGEARALLAQAERCAGKRTEKEAEELAGLAAAVVEKVFRARIEPSADETAFVVRGQEDANGINWTLRQDLADLAEDARRLGRLATVDGKPHPAAAPAVRRTLTLVARYHQFIARQWTVSDGTRQRFEAARDALLPLLPEAERRAPVRLEAPAPDNPYLERVDEAVRDPDLRAVIRRVQPACVRIGEGSGVNVRPEGYVLTCAHVAGEKGASLRATFPDGQTYEAECVAVDGHLDLALCRLKTTRRLPVAALAAGPPDRGDRVVCIGQPATRTPEGKPTRYQPFHVSVGAIRGFLDNPLGPQKLGRTRHDAWTYWGHSGSPLFNEAGAVVALHNSWDSTTAMRHAVPQQAIRDFLRRALK